MFKHMVVKTITITENAYNSLKKLKHGEQSFSEIIIEVTKEKHGSLDRFFGILKGSEKELDKLKESVKSYRKKFDMDSGKRTEKLRKQLGR